MSQNEVRRAHTAYSSLTDTVLAVGEVIAELGVVDAAAVIFFVSPVHDCHLVAARLAERFPGIPTIGCTTSGEFDQTRMGNGGIAAVALPATIVNRAASALATFDRGVDAGLREAAHSLEEQLGLTLRDADPERYVGLVLIDGMHAADEQVNEVLGNLAPLLSFVGGTAGDDLKFVETRVFNAATGTTHGAALMLLDLASPYAIIRTCSFEPVGHTFCITDAEPAQRIVWAIDGRPAVEVFAEAVDVTVSDLCPEVFAAHPVGLMVDGEPWIRCIQTVVDGRGLKLACQILVGMEVELMRHTNLLDGTATAIGKAVEQVGGAVSGAVLFDCAYRKLQVEASNLEKPYIALLSGIPAAGFHTYGESWLGHMNYTLTGLIFG
jgi:hypothetical protein